MRDAADLADLLRMGRLPEAYIATGHERELRELVREQMGQFNDDFIAEAQDPAGWGDGRTAST